MKKILLSFLLLCGGNLLFAQKQNAALPVLVSAVEGVNEYRLSNGLKILLVPDATQSNIIVNIVYHVGSRHEGYGESGMAHLLEHMLFKPSKKFGSIKQTIADKGAFANGTTWYDRTDYFEILPATDSNLIWSLDMESDRMVNSLMRNEDLQKEFSVVRNEFEANENYPSNILQERIVSSMYLWHNYGKSTIGSKEDIERVPIENLKKFYQKYYQPDNATLIVGGKIDIKKTLGWIVKYFGPIPKPNRIPKAPYTLEPPQDGERYVELNRNGDISYVGMGFHTPAYADKDFAANRAAIEILKNDPSGILYKALVNSKLATNISGYSMSLHDPGFSYFECSVPKGKSLDSAKNAFLQAMDNLPNTKITAEDLDRAKNKLLKGISDVQNNTINFCIYLADIIGAGDWRLFYLYRDQVEKLTVEEVQNALNKYYIASNRTWGVFIPDKNAKRVVVSETPDINALVKNYKGKERKVQMESFEASIDNIKKHTLYGKLSNGFKYALLKKPVKGDKIYASISFRIGDEKSLSNKNIIPELTARMLKYGTTSKSKQEINDLLAKIKSNISIYGGGGMVTASVTTDKENATAAFDLLADIILHPSFDKNEFDKMLLDIKGDYESGLSDPQNIANIALGKKLTPYPKGHPNYTESNEEKLEDLKAIKLEDLKNFYSEFYGANYGYGVFVGNIDQAADRSYLEKTFGNFNCKQPYTRIADKYFDIKGSSATINIPDKTNANCFGGINLPIKETDPDFPALNIANELLGGGAFLSSRIPERLRETEGMSYGAGSFLSGNFNDAASMWGLYAIFNPIYKNRLDSALRNEIDKALQSGFTQDEFKKVIASWLQQRKTLLGFDGYLRSLLSGYIKDNRDLNEFTEQETKVKQLKLEAVNAALKKYISNDKITIIYAGDFEKK